MILCKTYNALMLMTHFIKAVIVFSVLVFLYLPAVASDRIPLVDSNFECPAQKWKTVEKTQDWQGFVESLTTGMIRPGPPAELYANQSLCDENQCGKPRKIKGKTDVIVENYDDKYACITHAIDNGFGYKTSIIRRGNIIIRNKSAAWIGAWKIPDRSKIIISKKGDIYHIKGNTSYHEKWSEIDGYAAPMGSYMKFIDNDGKMATKNPKIKPCTIDMVTVGDFVIMHDNMLCGETNVRFMGIYKRVMSHN